MSVKTAKVQHLSAPVHVKHTYLSAATVCLRYIHEVSKRKLDTAGYSDAEKEPTLKARARAKK